MKAETFRSSVLALQHLRLHAPPLKSIPATMIAGEAIASDGDLDGPRGGKDYNSVARTLRQKLLGGGALSTTELRDAAWCLWTTDPALAGDSDILERIVDSIRKAPRRQPKRALASSYLTSFNRDNHGINVVAAALDGMGSQLGTPWDEANAVLRIFDVSAGPTNIGRNSVVRGTSPSEMLREHGIRNDAETGFAEACAAAALVEIVSRPTIPHEERFNLISRITLTDERTLRFPNHAPLVVEALLNAFGNAMPEKSVRDLYLGLLIRLFGDPRLKPGGWIRMAGAEAVVRRWLTEQSLRQFLDVVDRVALERMWKYRRAFWEAVYRADLISEAWVVFDKYGTAEARRVFGDDVSFGKFILGSGQVQQGQAVLLLRIGRGLVAEWSHNGKCHIWSNSDSKDAPRISQLTYHPSSLRGYGSSYLIEQDTFSISHLGAESYSWQSKVAAKLHHMTGVRIPNHAYKVP